MTSPNPMRDWTLSVDFGTSNTTAAHRTVRGIAVLPLTHHGNSMVSSIHIESPDHIEVGAAAIDRAALDPTGLVLAPKRLIGQGMVYASGYDVPLDLSIAALLTAVIDRGRAAHRGEVPARLVMTHPEGWSPREIGVLLAAAVRVGYDRSRVVIVSEPRAAAHFYADTTPVGPGERIAVFDFGGGTLDIALLAADADGGFRVIAARGDNALGGKNFDAAIRRWVDATLAETHPDLLTFLRSGAAPHAALALDESVRRAKELLAGSAAATVTVPDPRTDTVVTLSLTRDEFEVAIAADVERAAALTAACFADAGSPPVGAIYLTGGSSRIPLVHRMIGTLGPIATLDDPKTVVARGALIAEATAEAADGRSGARGEGRSGAAGDSRSEGARGGASTALSAPVGRGRILLGAGAAGAIVVVAVVAATRVLGAPDDAVVAAVADDAVTTAADAATGSATPLAASLPDDVESVEVATTLYLAVLGTRDEQIIGPMRCSTSTQTVDDLPPRTGPAGELTMTPRAFLSTTIDGDTATSTVRISAAVDGVLSAADGDGSILTVDLSRENGAWKICDTRDA